MLVYLPQRLKPFLDLYSFVRPVSLFGPIQIVRISRQPSARERHRVHSGREFNPKTLLQRQTHFILTAIVFSRVPRERIRYRIYLSLHGCRKISLETHLPRVVRQSMRVLLCRPVTRVLRKVLCDRFACNPSH